MTLTNLQSDKQLQNHQCCEQQAAECRQSPSNKVLCHKAWAKSFWMLWRSSPGPLHGMSIDNSPVSLSLFLSLSLALSQSDWLSEWVTEWESAQDQLHHTRPERHPGPLSLAQTGWGSRGTQRSCGLSAVTLPPQLELETKQQGDACFLRHLLMSPTAESLLHTCLTLFSGEQGGLSPLLLLKVTDYFTEQQHASL